MRKRAGTAIPTANSRGEVCEYRGKYKFILFDKGKTARVSIWIDKSQCEYPAISIRIHTAQRARRPIDIVDRNVQHAFGKSALPFKMKISIKLAAELIDDLIVRKDTDGFRH